MSTNDLAVRLRNPGADSRLRVEPFHDHALGLADDVSACQRGLELK